MNENEVNRKMNRIISQLVYLSESSLSLKIMFESLDKVKHEKEIKKLSNIVDFCSLRIFEMTKDYSK